MALSAKDQRERDWLAFYCLAEQYRREHGDLLVPNDYVYQGKRLGAWIGTQRMEYKSRTNPRFTQARVDLLNAIGMVWDVRQFQWNRMYQALERYLQKHGTARVPQSYVTEEGVKLAWFGSQKFCAGRAGSIFLRCWRTMLFVTGHFRLPRTKRRLA